MRLLTVFVLCVVLSPLTHAQEWVLTVPERAIFSIAANPRNPLTLVAGQYARAFVLSTDGGVSWQELSVQDLGGASQVSLLRFHPRDTTILFAGGVGFTGLDRSTDGGYSWENVLKDPDARRMEFSSNGSMSFHPTNPDTVYLVRSNPGIVYRSMNGGENWDSIGAIPGLTGTSQMRTLAVCPDRDSTHIILVSGRPGYMYRSTDGGRTFVAQNFLEALHPDSEGSQIRWSPTVKGRVYATVSYSLVQNVPNGGLYVSDDYGKEWKRMRFVDTALQALEVFPTPNGDEIFVGGAQNVLSAPQLKGDSIIYRSVDGGQTWQNLSTVAWGLNELGESSANVWGFAQSMEGNVARLFMATEVGIYRTDAITSVSQSTNEHAEPLSIVVRGRNIEISTSDASHVTTVTVADLLGRIVAQRVLTSGADGACMMQLPVLPNGAYIVNAQSGARSGSTLIQSKQ